MCGGCGFRSMSRSNRMALLQKKAPKKISTSRKKRDRHGNKRA